MPGDDSPTPDTRGATSLNEITTGDGDINDIIITSNNGSGSSEWGQISGNIADQTDLANQLADKASTTDLNNLTTVVNDKATTKVFSVTIPVENWPSASPYTQTVSVSGVLSTDVPVVDIILNSTTATAKDEITSWGYVSKITTDDDSITVTCLEQKPTVNMSIHLKVVR